MFIWVQIPGILPLSLGYSISLPYKVLVHIPTLFITGMKSIIAVSQGKIWAVCVGKILLGEISPPKIV